MKDWLIFIFLFILFLPIPLSVVDLIWYAITNNQLTSLYWSKNYVLVGWTFISYMSFIFIVVTS